MIHRTSPPSPSPLYYRIYAALLERIESEEFPEGKPLPPERQLAVEYGVSRITVIKALNMLEEQRLIDRQQGRGTFVRAQPRPQLPDARPRQRHYTLAVLVNDLSNPYFGSIVAGIAGIANANQCHLHIYTIYGAPNEELAFLRAAVERKADGVIVYPLEGYRNQALYTELCRSQFPLVMIDRYYPDVPTDRVVFDDERGGYDITSYLIKRGHTRIAVLPQYEVEVTSVRSRLRGYRQALEEHHLAYDDDMVWPDVYAALYPHGSGREHEAARGRLLKRLRREKPTAIFALNYDVARQVADDLEQLRLDQAKPPGNSDASAITAVEVAGLSYQKPNRPYRFIAAQQSGEALGERAARMLIGRLDGTLTGDPQFVKLPLTFHAGHSPGAGAH